MTDQNKSDRLENVGNLTLTSLEFHVCLKKRLVDGAGGGLREKSSFQESRVSSEQVSGCQLCRAHVLAYFADLTIKSARTRLQRLAIRR
jgi:coenzyme F420-reducing hydrogenase beta subunit